MNRSLVSRLLVVLLLCMGAAPAWAGNGEALLKYVPSNTRLVVNVNTATLRATRGYAIALNAFKGTPKYNATIKKLGFPDLNSFDTVMLTNIDANENDPQLFVAMEGRFDRKKIEAEFALQKEIKKEVIDGVTCWVAGDREAATFANDTTLLVGAKATLVASVKGAAGATGAPGSRITALASSISRVDRGQEIWFAASVSTRLQARRAELKSFRSMRGTFDVGAGLAMNAIATLDSAASATAKAADLTKQFSDGAASKEMAAIGFNNIFQSMKATAAGSDVTLTASYPQAQWENLLRTATAVMAEELR